MSTAVPEPMSLWLDQGPPPVTRPSLEERDEADVVIVGGGYSGLWTAYYLLGHRPRLRVVVVEAEYCGYGASGRNGGWVSPRFAGSKEKMAARHGADLVVAYQRAMIDAVGEVGRVAEEEAIDCNYRPAGIQLFAIGDAQVGRLQGYASSLRRWGFAGEDVEWLDGPTARARFDVAGLEGAMFNRQCASIHPWRLAVGLAAAVERRGGVIYERSRVRTLGPGLVVTDAGSVRSPVVIRCTEGFTPELPGHERELAPVYSLMVATEPLAPEWWERTGLEEGQAFSDGRHLIVYGQRTVDGRFAFGGRGAPYHFGSTVRPDWDTDARTHDAVTRVLWELFPHLGGVDVTHRWGGAVAIPRDWRVSVDFDPATGMGHAGGYVGQGVTGSHLAARTLAELVVGEKTSRSRLPFVGHRWRRWEPEPLRWVGINLGRALAPLADARESRTGRPSKVLGGVLDRLTGG